MAMYFIEEFSSEYKLDKKRIEEIRHDLNNASMANKQNLESELLTLFPENYEKVPETIFKKNYFIQGESYALQKAIQSDLAKERALSKKMAAAALKENNFAAYSRFNSKQKAIKVIMNTEYGAGLNSTFAHYNPDISATITCASRQLIHFLTNCLEATELYVDKEFLEEFSSIIDTLRKVGVITNVTPSESYISRFSLRRMFNEFYEPICKSAFKLNLKPSSVIYQDTDSNYYVCETVKQYFKELTPDTVNQCMKTMLEHNTFFAKFIEKAISRPPIALSFEEAFIVCRYLNRKKKYYGVKWSPDMEGFLPSENYENNILKEKYKWQPKKTTVPNVDGSYVAVDSNKLLKENINYLDYINEQNVKCVGVDLVRRDQYKFINYFHIIVLQEDLRLIKYLGNNKWESFSEEESMENIIQTIIEKFRRIINDFIEGKEGTIDFSLSDFAKNCAYRPDKHNPAITIVERLKRENKTELLPNVGDRLYYVVLLDEDNRRRRERGLLGDGDIAKRSYILEEFKDDSKNKVFAQLDHKYYLEALAKSMALYIIPDLYPDEIRKIERNIISEKEGNKVISTLQDKVASMFVKKYFNYGSAVRTELTEIRKPLKINFRKVNLVKELYPEVETADPLRLKVVNSANIAKYEEMLSDCLDAFTQLRTSSFLLKNQNNKIETLLRTYRGNIDALKEEIYKINMKLSKLKKLQGSL
jgi:hypothetical protein